MQVMAAVSHAGTRCLVAFECRDTALRGCLLAAAHLHFAQVWARVSGRAAWVSTTAEGAAVLQVDRVPLSSLPFKALRHVDYVEVYALQCARQPG